MFAQLVCTIILLSIGTTATLLASPQSLAGELLATINAIPADLSSQENTLSINTINQNADTINLLAGQSTGTARARGLSTACLITELVLNGTVITSNNSAYLAEVQEPW